MPGLSFPFCAHLPFCPCLPWPTPSPTGTWRLVTTASPLRQERQVRVGGADEGQGLAPSVEPRGAPARPGPAPPRAPPPRAPGRRPRRQQYPSRASAAGHPRAGPAVGPTDRGCRGPVAAQAGHGGLLVRRGPRRSRPRPRELRAAAADPAEGRVLGVLHCRVWAYSQRGLCERGQRPGTALHLQWKRGCLPLRRRAGTRGFPRVRRLLAAGRALPADQQRPRPSPCCSAGPGVLRSLVLPVVRGLLLPHQSVAAHRAGARHRAGWGRCSGCHRFQLLLHPQLGGAHCEGPAAVPTGHRHVTLRHRAAGHRGRPGLPRVPGGQRRGRYRDLPEPALHRDPGHQPQRVPGTCLLMAGRCRQGLKSHPNNSGPKASWDLPQVLPTQSQGHKGWPLWASIGQVEEAPLGCLGCPHQAPLARGPRPEILEEGSTAWDGLGKKRQFLLGLGNLGLTCPLHGQRSSCPTQPGAGLPRTRGKDTNLTLRPEIVATVPIPSTCG